jgi:hypothetical protein
MPPIFPVLSSLAVDCYGHVDRGMMKSRGQLKKSAYIETARMLSKITDRGICDRGMEIVLAEWRFQRENEFADWFESVYLAEDWDLFSAPSFMQVPTATPRDPNHNLLVPR